MGINDLVRSQLKDSFKDVDLDAELSRMALWLESPKGLKRTGNLAFVMKWLSKSASRTFQNDNTSRERIPIAHLLDDYLEDLWKDLRPLLNFNTKKS